MRLLPALVLAVLGLLSADQRPGLAQNNAPGVLRLLPADASSDKSITLASGRALAYTATAGTLMLYDQNGEKSAAIFYTAYVAKDRAAERPVTFAFNGGPGAASAYLHLGLAGPRVIEFGPQGNDGAAAKLIDNPDTWLAFTDLVFIDPIAAGWSRTVRPDAASQYFGVRRDATPNREELRRVLEHFQGNVSRVATFFGRERRQVYRWAEQFALDIGGSRSAAGRVDTPEPSESEGRET